MERRLLQRAGYVVGGLVLVTGAVVALRNSDTPTAQKPPPPPPVQTTVRDYADEGVLVPQPGAKPAPPKDLRVVSGAHRLQAIWTPDKDMAGYEVQVHGDRFDKTKLVIGSAAQFDNLPGGGLFTVSVRAVDVFGQRSGSATQDGQPAGSYPDESFYPLIDQFDGKVVPDPARWQLAYNAACAHMTRGAGEDARRMVISAACGNESVALRSRTPLRLNNKAGRVMIETDAPGAAGEMTLDLVPGPADLIETTTRSGPPPGTLRVRITPTSLEVPGAQPIQIDPLQTGLSTRWEFALAADGIRVWRNGSLVGSGPAVPAWNEATPLFSFTGPANGLTFVAIDALGLSNADTPAFVPPPRITTTPRPSAAAVKMPGQLGGQLRMTIRSSYGEAMPGPFTVTIGQQTFPAEPAVAGQQFESGLRFPVVANLPADAVVVNDRNELSLQLHSATPNLAPQLVHAALELVPDPAMPVKVTTADEPMERPKPTLPLTTATLLDASGGKIESGHASPRGRVILDITTTADGPVAGLAGVEVWVDNKRIAGLATNRDGPGIGGHWRLALNTAGFPPGIRDLELKAISTDGVTSPQFTTIPWQIPS
ncbi:hypothetical protein [Actinocrispum sp. NPDC049592]|uniref:hypothetical protein n=1 Tax=Actinocrispum sp. NPDC049592 TaxID=3154835 RepID=UPI003426CE8D